MTIVVTGATGQLGRLVVQHLLTKVPAAEIAVSVRNPAQAYDLGVEVRQGDFEQPNTLDKAFAGADKLLVISSQGDTETRLRQHLNAIDAARRAGVGQLVYTSLTKADTSKIFLADTHRPTEEAIVDSGIPYTILRNNWYLENELGTVTQALVTDTIVTSSKNGRFAPAAREDYAQAAATVLASDGHRNVIYELGAPRSFTYADFARAISEVVGREIRHIEATDEQLGAQLSAASVPAQVIELIQNSYQAIGRGELDVSSDTLAKLLGGEPTSLTDWVTQVVRNHQS